MENMNQGKEEQKAKERGDFGGKTGHALETIIELSSKMHDISDDNAKRPI